MKKSNVFYLHPLALAALFILGGSIISFPISGADEYTFLGYMSASVLGVLLYIFLMPLINKIFTYEAKKDKSIKNALILIAYIFTALICLYLGATEFWSFGSFLNKIMLQHFSKVICFIILLLTCSYFVTRRNGDILKFSLITFTAIAIIIVLFFVFSLKNFNFENIIILNIPKWNELYSQFKMYIVPSLSAGFLIAIYEAIVFKRNKKKTTVFGLITGFILLGLCILNSVLLFGPRLAATISYPYTAAVSTVTVGRLFTRLDGLSYFVYFVTALIKITVCFKLVWLILKRARLLF